MEYDRIILELLDRVRRLEDKAKELKGKETNISTSQSIENVDNFYGMKRESYTERVVNYMHKVLKSEKEKESVILVSNNLQRASGIKNRIHLVCNTMRHVVRKVKNEVVVDTLGDNSSTYTVRFYL